MDYKYKERKIKTGRKGWHHMYKLLPRLHISWNVPFGLWLAVWSLVMNVFCVISEFKYVALFIMACTAIGLQYPRYSGWKHKQQIVMAAVCDTFVSFEAFFFSISKSCMVQSIGTPITNIHWWNIKQLYILYTATPIHCSIFFQLLY